MLIEAGDQAGASGAEPGPLDAPRVLATELDAATVLTEVDGHGRWRWRAGLLALALAVAGARFWFSHNRLMFHMAPDEPAQLAMARFLSGGTRWSMFDHASWRPGMAVLMAPLFRITDDTATIMRGGLLIAAVLGGVGAVQLAMLGRRLTLLTPTASLAAAGAIAVSASSLSATSFVWAEALVTVCFLWALMSVLAFYDEPRLAPAMAAVAATVVGFTAHSRLLPLVPIVVVLLLARCVTAKLWRSACVVVATAAAATLASYLFVGWVFDEVWDKPGTSNTVKTIIDRLPKVTDNLRSALGQVWYQLVATAGLTAIGVAVLVARSRRHAHSAPRRVIRDARLVLLMTLPLVAVSMVFMSGRTRTDHRIYGRYNDAILWPVLLVAIGWIVNLARTSRRLASVAVITATVGAIVGAGVSIDRVAGDALRDSIGVRPMVAGLVPLNGADDTVHLMRLTVGAAIVLVLIAFAAVTRRGTTVLAVLAVAISLAAGVRVHSAMGTRLNSWRPAIEVVAIEEFVPPGATLGFRFVREDDDPPITWDDQRRRAQLYQFALPGHRFERDRGVDDAVGPFVFAPIGDPTLEEAGAKLLWRDPRVQIGLWREPPATG